MSTTTPNAMPNAMPDPDTAKTYALLWYRTNPPSTAAIYDGARLVALLQGPASATFAEAEKMLHGLAAPTDQITAATLEERRRCAAIIRLQQPPEPHLWWLRDILEELAKTIENGQPTRPFDAELTLT